MYYNIYRYIFIFPNVNVSVEAWISSNDTTDLQYIFQKIPYIISRTYSLRSQVNIVCFTLACIQNICCLSSICKLYCGTASGFQIYLINLAGNATYSKYYADIFTWGKHSYIPSYTRNHPLFCLIKPLCHFIWVKDIKNILTVRFN